VPGGASAELGDPGDGGLFRSVSRGRRGHQKAQVPAEQFGRCTSVLRGGGGDVSQPGVCVCEVLDRDGLGRTDGFGIFRTGQVPHVLITLPSMGNQPGFIFADRSPHCRAAVGRSSFKAASDRFAVSEEGRRA
jgi:hypothetical protein